MRQVLSATALLVAVASSCFPAIAEEVRLPYAHTLYAIIKRIGPTQLIVLRRNGLLTSVDISIARRLNRTGVLSINRAVSLHGDYDGLHAFHVVSITGAAGRYFSPATWPQDE